MFSFLDMLNHSLGYFNINTKLKNKIYTIVALLGDGYLIYVTYRLLANHVWVRGLLYCLAVLLISYYVYLNAVYYFLDKTSRFDVLSPWLVKITGYDQSNENPRKSRSERAAAVINNQANGYFTDSNLIQAEVAISHEEQRNLRHLVDQLVEQGIFIADYDGKDSTAIIDEYNQTHEPVRALNKNQTPPYFDLVHDELEHRLEIYAGLNQMERVKVGHITKVGLTDVHSAHEKYRLYLANVYVTGGPNKIPGRRGTTILTDGDFGLVAHVAYKNREQGNHPTSRRELYR
ncbi:MAG: DUF6681 family protein [Limosilactobacillus coleohominis]|uniref:DUF6681 family protein n=1 Tax=Limosilactobacillus coleohominis TaxID=181675 RepID=UPI002A7FDA99|nr:DUF6681 family protein [Limosilactobacillus coleohominis]MCI5812866.1 hypothetical protein [Lactobacillus sp.]MDY3702329.1 DUF6681 family protein [Limosilactobacillus coleohominis]MDY5628361.1 DUF6681 family protein [Limosilactobacillus coleohominis]